MSKSVSPENYQPNFSLLSWLVRLLLYGSVFASVFLPSYVAIDYYYYYMGCRRNKHYLYIKPPPNGHCSHSLGIKAMNNIGALNRAQQAYSLENNNKFSDSIKDLGLGIEIETYGYNYRIVQPMLPVQDLDRSISPESDWPMRMAIAQYKIKDNSQKSSRLENYLGVVYTYPYTLESGETEILTGAIVCQMKSENFLPTTMPKVNNGIMPCPVGSKQLGQ